MLLDTVDCCVSVIGLWFITFCKLGGGILTEKTKNMCSHATQLSWTLGQISHQLNLIAMIHHINGLSWLDVICRGGWVGGHGGLGGWPGRHGTTYDINLISNSITHSIQKNTFHKLYKPP